MKIYIFGNEDLPEDNIAINFAKNAKKDFKDLEFVFVKPNEDLPFNNEEEVVIVDVVMGITDITIIDSNDIDLLQLPPRSSAHDFDLAFQLKYLKKLGKISEVTIIGIPYGKKCDYSIFKSKLISLLSNQSLKNL